MYSIEDIFSLFPALDDSQKDKLNKLAPLYESWNSRINVISRKDIGQFNTRHLLHSLSIGLYHDLNQKSVLDVGTGGGFPGVPLAILFERAEFILLDSIGKKLRVIDDVCLQLEIKNVTSVHQRIEEHRGTYDVITGRAVKSLPQMYTWTKHLMGSKSDGNGCEMLYLKGGEFESELKQVPLKSVVNSLKEVLSEDEFFETKKLVRLY